MCNKYASVDPERYESVTRSIRLQGFVTSVRLENEFWDILETLAADDGYSVSGFIGKLYDEVMSAQGSVGNLTSMLRVSCALYLHRQVDATTDDKPRPATRAMDSAFA